MVEIAFDADTGALELPLDALELLAAVHVDPTLPETPEGIDLLALQRAGLLHDGGVHPLLATAMSAVAHPLVTAEVTGLLEDGTRLRVFAWIDQRTAVFAVPRRGRQHEIVTDDAAMTPALLAELLELGPRPRPTQPAVAVDDDDIDDLVRTGLLHGAAVRTSADAGLEGVADAPRARWRLRVLWDGPQGPLGREVELVDGQVAGWWQVLDGDRLELSPLTPTLVWRLLVALLPQGDELPGGPDPA